MSPLILLALATNAPPPVAWYGPGTATARIPFTGNPFDAAENDVIAEFTARDGTTERRLAYYVGDGKFSSTLVAHRTGTWRARFLLNGRPVTPDPISVVITSRLRHGFLGIQNRRFAWTDRTPYFPIGYNYAWRQGPNQSVAEGLTAMGKMGANWSRIWTNHWDDKNPFWQAEKAPKLPGRELRQEPLKTWDGITAAAERSGVNFQFVLFHHGPYSTTTDSNWKDHPWNTANGGFLADPTDFFTNEEAKRRSKIWLRYAVARYAHSPAIMAWELFNEVQWVDAIKKNPARAGDVAVWHKEMAAYIRSLDPYHHLVTSSSNESLDNGIFAEMDYDQPHTYPANVLAAIGGYRFGKKPGFFGEFGPPGGTDAEYAEHTRDGIYGGVLAGHAGAGQYWFWDQVDRRKLGPTFSAARKIIDESGLLSHPDAKPLAVTCETPTQKDAVLSAGGGWEKSSTRELNLPNVPLKSLSGWSQYFQSLDGGKKDWAFPLVLRFTAKEPGKLRIRVGQVSSTGGTLQVFVNDQEALNQTFAPPTQGDRTSRPSIEVSYPAGAVVVRLENHGADWIGLNSITVPAQAPTAAVHGLGDPNWALIRVVGSDTKSVKISGSGLRDGRYRVMVVDTTNSATSIQEVTVRGGSFVATNLPTDCTLTLKR